MICKYCSKPATIHLTDIVGGQKKITNICKECAEAKQLLKQSDNDLPGILQGLISKHIGKEADELSKLVCPDCGTRYMDFRAQGRLGCPKDYNHFKLGLEPLIEKIQHSKKHLGKIPKRNPDLSGKRSDEILKTRQELKKAIELESYEEAARLRDLLKEKENPDEF